MREKVYSRAGGGGGGVGRVDRVTVNTTLSFRLNE